MKMTNKHERALNQIGSFVANYRPDLNDKLTTEALYDVAVLALWLLLFSNAPIDDMIAMSFTGGTTPNLIDWDTIGDSLT